MIPRNGKIVCGFAAFALSVGVFSALSEPPAETPEWPQEVYSQGSKIVIYQPQPETFKDDRLTARAAVAVTVDDKAEPVFGAVWIDAHVSTDRDARTVTILDIQISKVTLPGATEDQEAKIAGILTRSFPDTKLTVSLDRLLAGISLAEKEQLAIDSIGTAPPKIVFASRPTVLVSLEGAPVLKPTDNKKLMRVVNTPFTILFDIDAKTYYLRGGEWWYAATDIMGPWKVTATPPASVAAAITPAPAPAEEAGPGNPPDVLVATEPTELIVTDGIPTYTPLEGTALLYMSNTESDVFMDIDSQQYYLLLAGRWYKAASLAGPWSYVASNTLPPAFGAIPPSLSKGDVLASVAGTERAKEAVVDAAIPQTAAVKRGPADIKVTYDGAPKFKKIKGTSLEYAVNTSDAVIEADKKYYCCRNAIWYVAATPVGPWEVCVSVPKEIYAIPPDCPVYNVRYVNVYSSTPDTVSVGYLPGYTGSYVYNNTVVYGTGYSYAPWCGAEFFPAPVTWGFGPVYNVSNCSWGYRNTPWGAYGYANWGDGHGGWWGPNGYHPWNESNWDNLKAHDGKVTVDGKTYTPQQLRNNLYHNRNQEAHLSDQAKSALNSPKVSQALQNNVFADRNGNVYRSMKDGWEQYGKNGWTKNFPPPDNARPSARQAPSGVNRPAFESRDTSQADGFSRPSAGSFGEGGRGSSFNRSNLDFDNYARQRGETRTRDFQQRSSGFSNRGGFDRGGFDRGGGGGGSRGGRR
ncbi:MAG: hypothetical protein NTZ78_06595 [Candidatus Aureabacteria bacterium]|nr:hypothetical protein [Candidatus Auribacterota bacterium]